MTDIQEQVERFAKSLPNAFGLQENIGEFYALVRSVVEECCKAATEYDGEWQYVNIADNIRRHFDWLEK